MVKDSEIKAKVSPFAIKEGEIKQFDGFEGYVSIVQITNKIDRNHITELEYKILEYVDKYEFMTSRQINMLLEMDGIHIDNGRKMVKKLDQMLKTKLLSRYYFGSLDEKAALEIQHLFSNSYFRVYTGTDLVGAELSGAVKNCLAIAAGISDGLGFGDNSKAALITRGINEILEIGKYYHADPKTFMGLSGLGDIIVTCTSKHSRNRYVGEELGKGRKIDDIISSMKMVSEGAETIKALYAIIKENNIQAPIMSALYEVIYENRPVNELVSLFMNRNLRSEFI